ncbi:MAG: HAD family phosphatase [Candidatus Dependentiae bacterium]|nr:HAD family phosphatase [Candidatus Dependentiae bacterium]
MKITRNLVALCAAIVVTFTFGYIITMRQQQNDQNNRRFKAIIFDMDGTIIDTDHLWKSANRPILDQHAPHLGEEEKDAMIDSFKHLTFYELWKIVQQNCVTEMTIEEIAQQNRHHVQALYRIKGISVIPHFYNFHEKVVNSGLKTAIATSSEQETVDIILEMVPLKNCFGEHIYNVDHVNKAYKPNPAVYLHAAKMLGVEPCNCIAIEDSSSGIKAAKAAGMYCIGINTGKNRNILQQADEIVDCFSEIDLEKLLNLKN